MVGYNILPIGFSSYEKSTIETFFRLAGRRTPHWGLTARSSEARVILFNATSQQDIEAFRSLVASWQKVIIVGSSDYGTGWAVLPRPIKLTAILGLLDTIAKESEPKAVVNAPDLTVVTPKPSATDVFANVTAKVKKPAPVPVVVAVETERVVQIPALVPMDEAPSFVTSSQTGVELGNFHVGSVNKTIGTVLIVDDSDIALKYMQNRLRHFGYESDMARSGDEALAMVASKSYQFVFLDVMMQGLDGYQTCRSIKNNKARRGPPPVVVMLTSRGGTIDKIRGTMAGCDAYMTKPLNEKQLTTVLAKFDDSTMTQRYEAANPRAPLVDTYVPNKR
jgi:two-component system, cell cycle response regulator